VIDYRQSGKTLKSNNNIVRGPKQTQKQRINCNSLEAMEATGASARDVASPS